MMPICLSRALRAGAVLALAGVVAANPPRQPAAPTVAEQAPPRSPATPAPVAGATPATPAGDTATLVIHHQPVVVFRAPLGALTPRERATAAARRITALVEADGVGGASAHPIPEGYLVTVGGQGVFSVTPADLDPLVDERLGPVATRTVARLGAALAAQREERSLPHLLWAAGLALVATLAVVVVLRLVRWSRRRLTARLLAAAAARLPDLHVRGFSIFSRDSALALVRRLVDLLAWGVSLFAAYVWLAFVLTRFAYSRPWGDALGGYLRATIGALALSAVGSLPGLFTVVVILVATRWLVRLVATFFDAVQSGSVDVPWPHPETASATKRIVTVLLWLFAVVVAYPYVPGSGSDVFKGVSVFAGLVISLGSSGIVNQAMSGLVLMYSRAFRPGDYVRVGEIEGTVTTLGMLSTKVRTTKQEEITLPNAVIVGASVKNFSRAAPDSGLLLHTSVTIGYDTPWRQVDALLRMAAARTEGLGREPAPFVLKTALSDFYVEYQLNAAVERPEQRVRVLDRLHANIVDAFNEYGVQITSPHYVADPPQPTVVPRERWHLPPAERPAASGDTPDARASTPSPSTR